MNNIILFGVGVIGIEAFDYFGRESVSYFTDNNKTLWGSEQCGKKIIGFDYAKELSQQGYNIVISLTDWVSVSVQLENAGIRNWYTFRQIEGIQGLGLRKANM
jgi:hypothetical protein